MRERRREIAAVCLLAVFSAIAFAYPRDPVAGWDDAVARWVADELPTAVEWLARPFSWLGGGLGMAVLALAAAGALLRRGNRPDAVVVALAYVSSEVANLLLKLAFDRPRPSLDPVVELPRTSAFPSGHATVSLAVLVTTAAVLGPRGAVRWAAVAAFAVGLSRIALGVHWTSDVVAGWALGGLVAVVLLLTRDRLGPRR